MTEAMITGTVENWHVEKWHSSSEYVIWGNIYGDTKGRFAEGTHIHTSALPPGLDTKNLKQGDVVHTHYSAYKLGVPYNES